MDIHADVVIVNYLEGVRMNVCVDVLYNVSNPMNTCVMMHRD